MAQISEPEPSAAAAPELLPSGWFPAVVHVVLFAGFGCLLASVREFKVIYDDLGAELTGSSSALMSLNGFFGRIHLPLWTLAVVGLAVDLGLWSSLRRHGRHRAADLWMCLGMAGVFLMGALVIWSLFLPLDCLVQSVR